MVITQRRAVHALLYLILSLLAIALIFFTLGAPFVAALEVIIYAGAIMVLFVFVIMMLNLGGQAAEQERHWLGPATWIGPGILAAILLAEVVYVLGAAAPGTAARRSAEIGPHAVGAVALRTVPAGRGTGRADPAGRPRRRVSPRPGRPHTTRSLRTRRTGSRGSAGVTGSFTKLPRAIRKSHSG